MKFRVFGRLLMSVVAVVGLGWGTPAVAVPGEVPADTGAKIVAEQWVDGQTLDITIDTPGVDSIDPKARILVPEGWSKDAQRTWPVLYVLPGGPDDYTVWTEKTDIEETAKKNDVIVVMPDAGHGEGFVNWYNGGKYGNPKWETFHTEELTQLVERNYRGSTTRAVMGISSGGSGAMMYATRHPGFYKYAASYSSILHPTKPGIPTMMMLSEMLVNGSAKNFKAKLGDPLWDRWNWLDHDPYVNAGNLRGTGIYISSGTTGLPGELDPTPGEVYDEKNGDVGEVLKAYAGGSIGEKLVGLTDVDMAARLKAMDIPATVHLYGNGLHEWNYWNREYKLAWPLIMNAIGAKPLP